MIPAVVHALEAAAHHPGRGAVAHAVRDAEAERGRARDARRVQRRAEQGRAGEEVGRVELELAEEIAPARRELRDRRVPARERGSTLDDRRELDGVRSSAASGGSATVGVDQLERHPTAACGRAVRAGSRASSGAPPRRDDVRSAGRVPTRPGPSGPRTAAAASDRAGILDRERELDLVPDAGRDPPRSRSTARRPASADQHNGRSMATVEEKAGSGESASPRRTLRDFFREMLLIRRFEEKVEERFRAGELPGFLHVAIGQEAVATGVCAALDARGRHRVDASRARAHDREGDLDRSRSWPSCTARSRAAPAASAARCTCTTSRSGTSARTRSSRVGCRRSSAPRSRSRCGASSASRSRSSATARRTRGRSTSR